MNFRNKDGQTAEVKVSGHPRFPYKIIFQDGSIKQCTCWRMAKRLLDRKGYIRSIGSEKPSAKGQTRMINKKDKND